MVIQKYIKRAKIKYRDKKKEKAVYTFIDEVNDDLILLCGYRKSGNTWVRFVIFNYVNILINGAETTLSFDELNQIQYHTLEGGVTGPFSKGFPHIYRTHWSYSEHKRIFDKFPKLIYIYRHPLDVITSLYHVNAKRTDIGVPTDINYWARNNTIRWINHFKSTSHRADLILNYERMRNSPYKEMLKVFELMEMNVDEGILNHSIELSSFENIKKMGRQYGQLYGNHPKSVFKGEFTRSGQSHQYGDLLNPYTISELRNLIEKEIPQLKLDWHTEN